MVQTFEKTFTAPSINSPACAGFTSSKASSLYPSLPKEPTAPSASVPGLDFGKNRRAPGPPRELTPTNNAVPCLGTKLSTLEIKAHKEPTVPIEGTKNLNELVRKNLKHHQQITELRLEEKSLQSNDRQHMENLVQDLRVARKCIKNQDNYKNTINILLDVLREQAGKSHKEKSMLLTENENHDLNDEFICAICKDRKREIIFLPCCHMISCQECASKVEDCSICRAKITEKAKIFK